MRRSSSSRRSIQRCLRLTAATALVGRALHFSLGDRGVDFLDQLDLGALQEAVQFLYVRLIEIQFRDCAVDLGESEDAELRAAVDEALDLFELLQFRY